MGDHALQRGVPATKPTAFEVVQSKSEKPYRGKQWRVTGYQDGKRKQVWFATEKQAKAHAAYLNREMAAYGTKLTLTPEMRLEATLAAELLVPYGKSILEGIRFYVDHLQRTSVSVPMPFSEVAKRVREEFACRLAQNRTRPRNVEAVHHTLRKLEHRFGNTVVTAITSNQIREWLSGLPLAAKTRNTIRGYTRQIFGLAVTWEYLQTNPVVSVEKLRERYNETENTGSLSALNTEALLHAADPEVIPFLALWFFTGIRRSTLEAMDWSEISLAERHAIVPRSKGKNQRRYRVTLSDNLIEWLKPHEKASGSLLAPSRAPQSRGKPNYRTTRKRVLQAAAKAGVTLPKNSGRNTFISMHVSMYESIDRTALESDNTAAVVKRDYLDIVTKADAWRFWNILPQT